MVRRWGASATSLKIYVVDFGTTERSVPESDMQQLPKTFLSSWNDCEVYRLGAER